MDKLNYCLDCKRIFTQKETCEYCSSVNIRELAKNAPVNVIGSKLKGRVLNAKQGMVQVLFTEQGNTKTIREYEPSKIRKVL
ncbi:hypothetical protein CDQ84_02220 [Clostridium thermosuccinogenes]|jgi:hypothetical protein|uniref:Uncharacterized protein n=1 Tax=Clostridium thermosuccinogenes TaxID=84032 RepID=A0A2K2FLK2_9CLOT|nr:hypothetical protein [Pseudoclostridium thermosuccinogenes]AUS96938.1 hypothetical protein CDO33_11140 [Pseudoclostridium thermosuccinogenes]PNT92393.1 hypothetical protein CDQ83_02100 [Pseudoclostridium thermosuccinogenes]PNT99645.1 hypothetical protein CDQ85_02115 [Pseudoclostridium thermosuccinogenes]PNU01221.1 hypothetical protein CDQ84_02220 [Pseudoclostridium thermosuccinogenes]